MSPECISKTALMTLVLILLLPLAAHSVSGSTRADDLEFRGIVDLGGSPLFSLRAEEGSAWADVGEVFAGYEIVEFHPNERRLMLRKDGEEYFVSLGTGRARQGGDTEAEDRRFESLRVGASNLRQVGQASLIFANDNDGLLPGGNDVETIHDVARLLASAGLNDASMWVTGGDTESGREDSLTTVLDESRQGLDPQFAAQNNVAIDFATNLSIDMPSTTPIAWTRGLREDGTWDESGAHGSSGGHIVFLSGSVIYASDLGRDGGRLTRPDGTPTANILEALPPEARVVGSGQVTLHGSTGSPGEGGE